MNLFSTLLFMFILTSCGNFSIKRAEDVEKNQAPAPAPTTTNQAPPPPPPKEVNTDRGLGINNKLRIDFTVSEELFDKNRRLKAYPFQRMKKVAQDHALKTKASYVSVNLALNPLIGNDTYTHFFVFNLESEARRNLNCMAIVNKDFSRYSAACYHTKE